MNGSSNTTNFWFKAAQIFGLVFLTASIAHAKIDLSKYELTEKQIELFARLEKRGISDDELTKLAQAFERSNTRKAVYVPEHTTAELHELLDWAEGGAFASFSRDANIGFDRAAYLADCPNLALFNYGRANATEDLGIDVLLKFSNTAYYLSTLLGKDPAEFRQAYLNTIRGTAFEKYVDVGEWNVAQTN